MFHPVRSVTKTATHFPRAEEGRVVTHSRSREPLHRVGEMASHVLLDRRVATGLGQQTELQPSELDVAGGCVPVDLRGADLSRKGCWADDTTGAARRGARRPPCRRRSPDELARHRRRLPAARRRAGAPRPPRAGRRIHMTAVWSSPPPSDHPRDVTTAAGSSAATASGTVLHLTRVRLPAP
jgi:hypothetical protein